MTNPDKNGVDFATTTFADKETAACPFAYYAKMRAEDPIHLDPGTGWYWVTRHDDVVKIAHDTDNFSSSTDVVVRKTFRQPAEDALKAAGVKVVDTFITSDKPEHDDFRRVASELFPPAKIGKLRDQIAQTCDQLIDQFIDLGEADLNIAFSRRLVGTILAAELGLPIEDLDQFKDWAECLPQLNALGITEEQEVAGINKLIAVVRYLTPRLEEARQNPEMAGTAIHTIATMNRRDGSPFTNEERSWMAVLTFIAGNNTTISMINLVLRKLAVDRDLQDRLRADPELINPFVEEMLRVEPSAQAVPRRVLRDTEVGGTTLPEGSTLFLCTASANRDESKWGDDAGEFVLGRPKVRQHIAFGTGAHSCMGLHLARAEIRASVAAMLARTASFELLDPANPPQQIPHYFTRGIFSLPLRFTRS